MNLPSKKSSWPQDIDNALSELWVPLRILVWGPGETNEQEWFDKRTKVIKALRDNSSDRDEVFSSEDLFKKHSQSPLETGYVELIHANGADLIIALVMASPDRQGGVYRELEIISQHRHLRHKVRIFLPHEKKWLQRFQAGMLEAYSEEQKIPVEWSNLKTCKYLRSLCVSQVEDVRKHRMFDRLIARLKVQGDVP